MQDRVCNLTIFKKSNNFFVLYDLSSNCFEPPFNFKRDFAKHFRIANEKVTDRSLTHGAETEKGSGHTSI